MRTISLSIISLMLASSRGADAACSTDTTKKAYGSIVVKRSGTSCGCDVYMKLFECGKTGSAHEQLDDELITTVSGDCTKSCDQLAGYDSAMATAKAKWTGANYECDASRADVDQDGLDHCLDENDADPRVGARVCVGSPCNETAETECDGRDGDGDGYVDDVDTHAEVGCNNTSCTTDADCAGLVCSSGSCIEDNDHKRITNPALLQGDSGSAAHLVDGALVIRHSDASVQSPFATLSLARAYNSRRNTNDVGFGRGWTHSYSVFLKQMPTADGRWRVLTPSGEEQYFRCSTPTGDDKTCVIDDLHPRGNLRRTGARWTFYPGDGTAWRFSETVNSTYGRAWDLIEDGTGNDLLTATTYASGNGTGLIEKVISANASIYLYFTYDASNNIDKVRINSTTGQDIVDYTVHTTNLTLDKAAFASSLGTIDSSLAWAYFYDATSFNMTKIEEKLSAAEAIANFVHDSTNDRVTSVKDRTKDFSISYTAGDPPTTPSKATVTFAASAGNTSTDFKHWGGFIEEATSDIRLGGLAGKKVTSDEHARVVCLETDDSRTYKLRYDADDDGATESDGTVPTKIDEFDKDGDCSGGLDATPAHETWLSWEATGEHSWRMKWTRTKSATYASPPSSCAGATLPTGCRETKVDYVSSSDDRVQWVTRTGYTKVVNDTVSQQVRKQRIFYFGLDTSICTSGDSYSGLACRVESQDSGGTVLVRTDYTYEPTGATAGLLKAVKRYKSSSTSLNTTYASHNAFGSPTTVTDERSMVTSYSFNGWNAVTQITETDAMKDDGGVLLDPVTSFSYNFARQLDTVTLPKGNKRVYKYFDDDNGYYRLQAIANADSAAAFEEISRYENDGFGRRTETKVLDSISGTTPCADEDSACTPDSRTKSTFDGIGRVAQQNVFSVDTTDPPDSYTVYAYTSGKLETIKVYDEEGATDILLSTTAYEYDGQGRVSKISRADNPGTDAETTFTYDGQGMLLTTTSPTGIVTRTEHNDFGEVVLERSQTRGDIHEEFNAAGRMIKRRETQYNSQLSAQDHCWTHDWLSRPTEYDRDCNGVNTNFYYDNDSMPASACESNADHGQGHLTMHTDSQYKRVLCYHKSGRLHSMYQVMGSSTWSNSSARGISRIYDLNGNLTIEYLEDRPDNTDHARKVEYLFNASAMADRIDYIRHKLTSAGSWTDVTSSATDPTYFAFGGFKTLKYANNIVETNTYNTARWLTRRKTEDTAPTPDVIYTDLNLEYDVQGRITRYNDSAGKRHLEYYAAYDDLNRLRCVGRASITSCSGVEPWDTTGQEDFLESLDYDKSSNRTFRRYGRYDVDDDEYTFVTGTDIIDKVKVAGTDKQMSNTVEGEITEVNTPNNIAYGYRKQGDLNTVNNNFLGDIVYKSSEFHDVFEKVSVCNARKTWFFFEPTGAGGTSHQARVLDDYNTCTAEYPRRLKSYIYLEGRPIAVVHSERASGSDNQLDSACNDTQYCGSFWIHTDQLGTPILATDSSGLEKWRWENDPFGREKVIEFGVLADADPTPDDDPSSGGDANKYNTCCCDACGNTGCNDQEASCGVDCCLNDAEQDIIWSKDYSGSDLTGSAKVNNLRLHFSTFDVAPGSTSRTGKDYVRLKRIDGTTMAELTGNLGPFWTPWAGEVTTPPAKITVEFVGDNTQDNTRGIVIDKVEYTECATLDGSGACTSPTGRMVLNLRMPGQIYDADAYASYNFRRWYRSEDGRYLTPDPIGLAGGEPGYFGYVAAAPLTHSDPTGLTHVRDAQATVTQTVHCTTLRDKIGIFSDDPSERGPESRLGCVEHTRVLSSGFGSEHDCPWEEVGVCETVEVPILVSEGFCTGFSEAYGINDCARSTLLDTCFAERPDWQMKYLAFQASARWDCRLDGVLPVASCTFCDIRQLPPYCLPRPWDPSPCGP